MNDDVTTIGVFMFEDGPKRIEDCTREELLIVVECLVREVQSARGMAASHLNFVKAVIARRAA